MQMDDAATVGKSTRTNIQRKDGKVFFTSPRVKAQSPSVKTQSAQQQPAWPYRSGKIVLKSSAKTSHKKQPVEPSWLDDDVFSFHAED